MIGWDEIYEELFTGSNGKKLISFQTLTQKHASGLKASGAVFRWTTGRGYAKRARIAGWKSVIQNYFIKLGQIEDAERVKAKAIKKQQKADLSMKVMKAALEQTKEMIKTNQNRS